MKQGKLKRNLGLFEATSYGVGIILGAGVYALIGKAAGLAGPALWMAFFIGAMIAAITGLSYAELGTIFPKEAAEYVYAKRAFKNNRIAFLLGWLILFVGIIAIAAVSLGFGGYLQNITGIPLVWGAIVLLLVMSFLNFWGIKQSARANVIFTLIEVGGLLLIILLGMSYFGSVDYFETPTGHVFSSLGFASVMAAAVLIFFAFIGFEDVVNMAEEMKDPVKNIPKALILAIIITTLIYVLVSISAVSVLDWQTLGKSHAPLADVAEKAWQGSGFLLAIIALFATGNTVLILLIVESRMLWGMANDGSLPRVFSKIHINRGTPWVAIITIAIIAIITSVFWDIKTIAEVTDLGVFIIYAAVNISLIFLRYKMPKFKRKFRVPLNIGRFPILPMIGVLFSLYMLTHFKSFTMMVGVAVIIIGWIMYEVMLKLKWIKR